MRRERERACFVLSNDVWTPPSDLALSVEDTAEMLSTVLDMASTCETVSILSSLPISDRTFLPAGHHMRPIQLSIDSVTDEIRQTFESTVKPSLAKHGLTGKDVSVVVTAGSTYSPLPPQSARLCNLLECTSDVTALNMTGTGNSMAVTALATAAAVLRGMSKPGVAVVAISENMSTLMYGGRDAKFLESNALKRLGCACIILSTRRVDKKRAKYRVCDTATTCSFFGPEEVAESFDVDDVGVPGFRRNKPCIYEANLINQVQLAYSKIESNNQTHVIVEPSHPDMTRLGYKALGMEDQVEEQDSSMSAFHAFGDVGPAACWYGLAHREASPGIKKGERVMLMAISGSLYTGTAILEACRDIAGTWENLEDPTRVREMFDRYYLGLPQRELMFRVSERDAMLRKVDSQMFYPYTHGIWTSDTTRFKKAVVQLEQLYRQLNADSPTG